MIIFKSITKRKDKKYFKTVTLRIYFAVPKRFASLFFIMFNNIANNLSFPILTVAMIP